MGLRKGYCLIGKNIPKPEYAKQIAASYFPFETRIEYQADRQYVIMAKGKCGLRTWRKITHCGVYMGMIKD